MNNQIEEVLLDYPLLNYCTKKNILQGEIIVDEEDNDSYDIKIDIVEFPYFFPKVWEIGERIPPKFDRHINRDLSCCFTTQAKENIYLKTKVKSLKNFLDFIVIPFFQNNSFFELNGNYKNGEHSHNSITATHETYEDILGIKNIGIIIKLIIDYVFLEQKTQPNQICYCGSNFKLKHCKNHLNCYQDFLLINETTLLKDYCNLFKLNGGF